MFLYIFKIVYPNTPTDAVHSYNLVCFGIYEHYFFILYVLRASEFYCFFHLSGIITG